MRPSTVFTAEILQARSNMIYLKCCQAKIFYSVLSFRIKNKEFSKETKAKGVYHH